MAQPVKVSKWKSVVVDSNPAQANSLLLLLKSFIGEYHMY